MTHETYREPLRWLIGRFEAQLARDKVKSFRDIDLSLWNFFSHFPRKSRPEQFALADAEDYRVWRSDEGRSYATIRKELGHVRMFFRWLQGLPEFEDLAIPVVVPTWPEVAAQTNPGAPSSKQPEA
jgi:site-specific recombinase XerD